jgi:hypothetical protein
MILRTGRNQLVPGVSGPGVSGPTGALKLKKQHLLSFLGFCLLYILDCVLEKLTTHTPVEKTTEKKNLFPLATGQGNSSLTNQKAF